MKALIATLAIVLSSLVSAHATTINTQVSEYFYDAYGNTGIVFVDRKTDPSTNKVTTTLVYSFCVQTTAASCLEGIGVIPNAAFTGVPSGDPSKPSSLKLLVDTTSVAGFSNDMCHAPDSQGGCLQGKTPATGGLINLNFATILGTEEDFTIYDWNMQNFKLVRFSRDKTGQGPASAQGTVIGTNVKNIGAGWGLETLSGLGSGVNGQAVTSPSQSKLETSLATPIKLRLQKLRGEAPAQ